MTQGSAETGRTFMEMAIDMNVFKLLTLESGLVVVWMVMSEGHIVVAAGSS